MPAGETEPSWVSSSENSKGARLLCGKYFSEEPHPTGLLTPGPELSSGPSPSGCLSVHSSVSSPTKNFLVTQIPATIFSSIANDIIALQELTLQPFSVQMHKIENNQTQTIALVLKAH